MVSTSFRNSFGFGVLGFTSNFAFTIMLAAAYDLLSGPPVDPRDIKDAEHLDASISGGGGGSNHSSKQPFCHEHSTATIMLADTAPALVAKIIYPFLLVSVPASYKFSATALFAVAAFTITGLTSSRQLIFVGVICASLVQGFGESTGLAITPRYGDSSLSGWSTGTGISGLCSAASYALLRMVMPIKHIMLLMLVMPVAMLVAYFKIIEPVAETVEGKASVACRNHDATTLTIDSTSKQQPANLTNQSNCTSTFMDKFWYLMTLTRYFLPLFLVYFSEYFINQGLFELIYYPEVGYLNHAAQYRWFAVSYQLGVMISRSSLEFFKLKNIWAMSLLQFVNLLIFLAHTAKVIHLPSFYLVPIMIVYEGLLGGFTYVNAFYRVKNETPPEWREFSISAVVIADTTGILTAGFAAIPVHDAICKLYV